MAALLAVVSIMASCQNDPFVVKTTNGRVRGFDEEGTMAFKGIPYAHAERCMPPAPVAKWDTILDCTEWGPQSLQSGRIQRGSAEDCCVLNVWTTDTKGKKPVMFWCHGGGFDSGTSAWNPGMGLAKKDVVVVVV